ncbi:MAG TPA: family 16 glycoside hydrolase [Terriglobales bacterium]|nr:family 16 glycoside hydrolase [Terriglobales bacterium]
MGAQAYLLLGFLICSVASAETIRFDGGKPGTLPSDWAVAMTHAGGEPRWQIVSDPGAPSPPYVLAQLSQDRTAGRFPLAIWSGAAIRNGEVSVAFKTVSGAIDQAAGIVWRYQDPNNYYIVRANALENNIVLYKVEKGVRLSLAPKGKPSRSYGVKHEVPKGQWNTLRIVFNDSHFVVYFNREQVFEAEDQTFRNAGRTGVWTKADSVTYFDDFSVNGN